MRALWRLEVLAYWLEAQRPDRGLWGQFVRLAIIILAVEGIAFLWIAGALRPL